MKPAILYVDDDVANLTVFEAAFGRRFRVLTAEGGHAALEILQHNEVGVLLVDQRMPGMTGVELLREARVSYPDPVRILVTAFSNLSEAIEAINQGHIRRYLRKPWNHDELQAALEDALEVYMVRRQLAAMERQMMESERVYALGVVAAGIAHEMRNPMMVLTGQLELAESAVSQFQESGSCDPERLARRLHAVRASATQVTEIMDGMSMAHRRQDNDASADLGEVVRLTLRSLRSSLKGRARLEVHLAELPPVQGTRTRLGQVVLNLLVNALQALPDGADPMEHRITVRLDQDGRQARLVVTDTGPGIPHANVERIFDPFFTTKADGGTGLGLAITRQIVEELGGHISVRTGAEQGTAFTVSLPLERSAEAPTA